MYIDALRYGEYDRVRHGRNFKEWLAKQAVRLSATSEQIYNALLAGYSSKQIEAFVGTPPVNTVAPVISGSPVVGQLLTTTNGTWTGTAPAFEYQWTADSVAIVGATGNTYALTAAETGKVMRCRVDGVNAAGSSSGLSNALGPVTAA